jgi:hypothetical protein
VSLAINCTEKETMRVGRRVKKQSQKSHLSTINQEELFKKGF